ncbi:MAG: alpha-1,2-fucosyltransferase [Methylococcaceae bacterium]
MIIVRIIGGLGNQMFQYAFGFSLSKRTGQQFKLDIAGFDSCSLRTFSLSYYGLKEDFATKDEVKTLKFCEESLITKLLRKTKKKPPPFADTYKSESQNSEEISLSNKGAYYDGYWQNEIYFKDYRKDLINLFSITSTSSDTKEYLQKISTTESVSLHVRRGDYVANLHTKNVHGLCDIPYYRDSYEMISRKVNKPHFFIFSDDLAWAKENLKFVAPLTFIEFDDAATDNEEVFLMSQCHHNIIANSSFSWWGAWLNQHENQVVAAPRHWFADKLRKTSSLTPKSWNRL